MNQNFVKYTKVNPSYLERYMNHEMHTPQISSAFRSSLRSQGIDLAS